MKGLIAVPLRPGRTSTFVRDELRVEAGDDGLVEVGDLWRILRHWHRSILALALLLACSALIYSLLTPWLYTATSQILIDPRDKVVLTNDVNPGALSPDGGVTQVESQSRVVESSTVLIRAINALGLTQDPEFAGSSSGLDHFFQALGAFGESANRVSDDAVMDRTLRALKRRLAIKRADKVFVIDVIMTAKSPDKAARIANAIADAYLADQAGAHSDTASRASDSLEARLSEQRAKLNDAEERAERYKAEHNLVAASGILVGDQQLSDINNQLSAARTKTEELRARIDQIDQARRAPQGSDATAEAIQSTVISQLRSRYAELVQHQADLRTQFGPLYPAINAVEAQLHDVQRLIAAELDRIARSARADYDRARANEAALAKSLDRQKAQTVAGKEASVRLHELERDAEAARTVYTSFLLRAQETREQAGVDTTNARVITRAIPPQDRSWPLIGFLVLGGFGGGLGIGASAALFGEYARPTILSRNQMESAADAAVIGSIPARRRSEGKPKSKSKTKRTGGADPPGDVTIALGQVLRRVFDAAVMRRDSDTVRTILIVSGPKDTAEKIRLTRLLALAAATKGERVLLVDAAALENDQPPGPGLFEVMRGERALDAVVKIKPRTGISVLGLGQYRAESAAWRQSTDAARLFNQARHRFDLMIVDGGVVADNPRIAPLVAAADEILLVGRQEKTLRADVTEAARAIRMMGRSVSGALLVVPPGRA